MRAWLAVLFLAPTFSAPADEYPGCSPSGAGWACEWHTDTNAGATAFVASPPGGGFVHFAMPVPGHSLATIAVELAGTSRGWQYWIDERGEDDVWRPILYHEAPAANDTTRQSHLEMVTHYLHVDGSRDHRLAFRVFQSGPSLGEATIRYTGQPLPLGVVPPRPAATREDPNVADDAGDAVDPALDITAVWFDDERIGDGVIELRLSVANLSDHAQLDGGQAAVGGWHVEFTLGDTIYSQEWLIFSSCMLGDPVLGCLSYTGDFSEPGTWCTLFRSTSQGGLTAVTSPACALDFANSTLVARIPERAVGEPGPGVLFFGISAHSVTSDDASRMASREATVHDKTEFQRYAFALGGPAVWDELNPRLAIPPDPWYVHPLAAENVADSLQIVGTVAAIATFLVGLLLVRRRRARLRRLLDEVDALAARHAPDARRGLLALGDLQTDMSSRVKHGRISESHYQIVSQRIAFVASQLSIRRDLGLDDGVPGEAVGVRR